MLKVCFRADDNTRNLLDTTEIDDLVVYYLDHVERISGGDGVHQDEAMDTNSVLRIQNRIFVLKIEGGCKWASGV